MESTLKEAILKEIDALSINDYKKYLSRVSFNTLYFLFDTINKKYGKEDTDDKKADNCYSDFRPDNYLANSADDNSRH